MGNGKKSTFDPRAGLWILIAANIIAFSDHTLWVELALIALLLALMIVPSFRKKREEAFQEDEA